QLRALHLDHRVSGAQGQFQADQGLGRPGEAGRADRHAQSEDVRRRPLELSRRLGLRGREERRRRQDPRLHGGAVQERVRARHRRARRHHDLRAARHRRRADRLGERGAPRPAGARPWHFRHRRAVALDPRRADRRAGRWQSRQRGETQGRRRLSRFPLRAARAGRDRQALLPAGAAAARRAGRSRPAAAAQARHHRQGFRRLGGGAEAALRRRRRVRPHHGAGAPLTPRAPMATLRFRHASALPGFGLALGYTLFYLRLVVLLPLAALWIQAACLRPPRVWAVATEPRVVAALRISFGLAFAAALVDCLFGLLIAWVLTRYAFPGRKLIDAAVDLPLALPTAVAGIALATLYAPNEWIGAILAAVGIKVAFTPAGIFVALVFVALPFSVRTVQPLIVEIDRSVEEASATLGAGGRQTVQRVILPMLAPAMLTGFALSFARAVSEYGSVIFIAGNLPYVSEIAPVLIVIKLEEYDYPGATAIAVVMLALAFCILLAINLLQA